MPNENHLKNITLNLLNIFNVHNWL